MYFAFVRFFFFSHGLLFLSGEPALFYHIVVLVVRLPAR
jgi:hypothetical protein